MSGINPISGLPLTGSAPAAAGQAPARAQAPEKGDFARLLEGYLGQVDRNQQASAAAIEELLTGRSEDVLPVVAAVARADMSFKLLLGIRNKVIEAYKQTISMQV